MKIKAFDIVKGGTRTVVQFGTGYMVATKCSPIIASIPSVPIKVSCYAAEIAISGVAGMVTGQYSDLVFDSVKEIIDEKKEERSEKKKVKEAKKEKA